MIRLNFVVEGQTEEAFVRDVLGPHLWSREIISTVRSVGGGRSYQRVKRNLLRWINEDRNAEARFTTMIDLYRLPIDFPKATSLSADPLQRVAHLEDAFSVDIGDSRFVPYIQLHEFESLLLTRPDRFTEFFPDRQKAAQALLDECAKYPTPEHVDDTPDTHPSRRILVHFSDYDKVAAAPIIANAIGLDAIRASCRHFDHWVKQLEALS